MSRSFGSVYFGDTSAKSVSWTRLFIELPDTRTRKASGSSSTKRAGASRISSTGSISMGVPAATRP